MDVDTRFLQPQARKRSKPDSDSEVAVKRPRRFSDPDEQVAPNNLCQFWASGNCVHGDNCRDVHAWFTGSDFSLLNTLERRHNKAIAGACFHSGAGKLFSASEDGCLCVYDSITGRCTETLQLGTQIGSMISQGPWLYIGVCNGVKAANLDARTDCLLDGPNGLVRSLAANKDNLFAGVEDGSILIWKSATDQHHSLAATLKGHTKAVTCLTIGRSWSWSSFLDGHNLYSGSEDGTIRVWDLKTLECLQIVDAHSDSVTAVLCWNAYLLSASLDNTIKVWALNEAEGCLYVVCEIWEETGVLALSTIHNTTLVCSRTDNTVRLYDLPLFNEIGKIFSKGGVSSIAIGCGGLFFTGDVTGQLEDFGELLRLHHRLPFCCSRQVSTNPEFLNQMQTGSWDFLHQDPDPMLQYINQMLLEEETMEEVEPLALQNTEKPFYDALVNVDESPHGRNNFVQSETNDTVSLFNQGMEEGQKFLPSVSQLNTKRQSRKHWHEDDDEEERRNSNQSAANFSAHAW